MPQAPSVGDSQLSSSNRMSCFAGSMPQARRLSRYSGWAASGDYPVTFIPTVSRPNDPANADWTGRTGRVESIVAPVFEELGLSPDSTVAYLCGNPDMILSAEQTLLELGLPETAVKKELYWPKGKEPTRAAAGGVAVAD